MSDGLLEIFWGYPILHSHSTLNKQLTIFFFILTFNNMNLHPIFNKRFRIYSIIFLILSLGLFIMSLLCLRAGIIVVWQFVIMCLLSVFYGFHSWGAWHYKKVDQYINGPSK